MDPELDHEKKPVLNKIFKSIDYLIGMRYLKNYVIDMIMAIYLEESNSDITALSHNIHELKKTFENFNRIIKYEL